MPYGRERNEYALNQYILPAIGSYRLRDITPMQIQAIMAGLSDKSNSVQSKVLINLRSIFNTAQENGLVAKSPVSNMLKPGGRKTPEKEALTVQESNLLLERVKNPSKDGPSHGDAARGDRGTPVGGHRLRGEDHSHPA